MSPKAITALAFVVVSLLAVVILVGLAQRTLDATGVAVALSSVVTGLVVGAGLRAKSTRNGDDT